MKIKDHEHTHIVYVRCLNCCMFGINLPIEFIQAAKCGNCGSMETVKYYPSCCVINFEDEILC